jgi:serine protease Do
LRDRGEVKRGWLGITMNDAGIDETARDYYGLPDTTGVLVKSVTEKGPAASAGLKVGDVIREVDGDRVRDNLDMITKISSRQPGERVRLDVFRRGRAIDLTVKLGDRDQGIAEEFGLDPRQIRPGREDEPEASSGLGLTVENLNSRTLERLGLAEDQQGVVITRVEFESEADGKGLRPTMVITAVNDEPVRDIAEWGRVIDRLRPGSPVKLDVVMPGGDASLYFFLRAPE